MVVPDLYGGCTFKLCLKISGLDSVPNISKHKKLQTMHQFSSQASHTGQFKPVYSSHKVDGALFPSDFNLG